MTTPEPWPAIFDERSVERLIPAIQQAIASAAPTIATDGSDRSVAAPDVANALSIVLATVLAGSPACATPRGARRLAEAAGRQLHQLMRETRQFQYASAESMKTLQ